MMIVGIDISSRCHCSVRVQEFSSSAECSIFRLGQYFLWASLPDQHLHAFWVFAFKSKTGTNCESERCGKIARGSDWAVKSMARPRVVVLLRERFLVSTAYPEHCKPLKGLNNSVALVDVCVVIRCHNPVVSSTCHLE